VDERRIGPRVVLAVDAAIDHLGIHAGTADVFADFVDDEDVDFGGGEFGHPGFHFPEDGFFLGDHAGETLRS